MLSFDDNDYDFVSMVGAASVGVHNDIHGGGYKLIMNYSLRR